MKYQIFLTLFFLLFQKETFAELQGTRPQTTTAPSARNREIAPLDTSANLRQGCESISYCSTNTHNRFDDSRTDRSKFLSSGGCQKQTQCPQDTKFVCLEEYFLKTCMDIDLRKEDDTDTPLGMQTFYSCQQYCESHGKRLPTNNEWLVAAIGTDHRNCLPEESLKNEVHPRKPDPGSPRAIEANRQFIRKPRQACISSFGIRDMVGVLGQWVTDGQAKQNRAQFNGGYWAFRPSSLFYRTTAHGPGYTDYSIGCRCATNPTP